MDPIFLEAAADLDSVTALSGAGAGAVVALLANKALPWLLRALKLRPEVEQDIRSTIQEIQAAAEASRAEIEFRQDLQRDMAALVRGQQDLTVALGRLTDLQRSLIVAIERDAAVLATLVQSGVLGGRDNGGLGRSAPAAAGVAPDPA